MEAAPSDLTVTYVWGSDGTFGNDRAIGSGKDNTDRIPDYRETDKSAAKACDDYEVNGYSDWFLPSIYELNLMYNNLKKKGIGGFCSGSYWSSSESDGSTYGALSLSFYNGNWAYYAGRVYSLYVRACRAF